MAYKIMKAVFSSLAAVTLLGMASCSDDETVGVNTASIKAAPDFVDSRDGHVYRCIQVGDQIWMAENLAYFIPQGAAAGCLTWNELQDFTEDSLKVDTTNIVVTLTDEEYGEVFYALTNDPAHDWKAEIGFPPATLEMWYRNFFDMMGQDGFTNMFSSSRYKPFGDALVAALDEARQANKKTYIENLLAEKALIPYQHRDRAEAANGGYVAENGYQYTYEGALRAVPEEGGWRVPSDADWKKLEAALGVPASELDNMNQWRGLPIGDAMKVGGETGFNAVFSGCNAYQRTQAQLFIRKGEAAYFWASDKDTYTGQEDAVDGDANADENGKVTVVYDTGIIRELAIYSSGIWRGTTRLDNGYRSMTYSVRLVRDAK